MDNGKRTSERCARGIAGRFAVSGGAGAKVDDDDDADTDDDPDPDDDDSDEDEEGGSGTQSEARIGSMRRMSARSAVAWAISARE